MDQSQPFTALSRARFFPPTTFGSDPLRFPDELQPTTSKTTTPQLPPTTHDTVHPSVSPTPPRLADFHSSAAVNSNEGPVHCRNVVQAEVWPLGHPGRGRPRVHHPHAQESTFHRYRQTKCGFNWVVIGCIGSSVLTGWFWNSCTVSPSRRGLPAPSRRSRPLRTRLWYADLPLTTPKRGLRPPRPRTSNKTSEGSQRPGGSRVAAGTNY